MNPYEILGVDPGADIAAINAAYRRAARDHHPDRGGKAETFAELQAAVELLRDPERRARYDETGEDGGSPSGADAAIGTLIDAFQAVIGSVAETFQHVDVIHATDAHLAELLAQLDSTRADAKLKAGRIGDALRRLRHTGDGPDPIRGALQGQERAVENILVGVAQQEATVHAARELLKGYGWLVDPKPVNPQSADVNRLMQQMSADQQRASGFGNWAGGIFGNR